MQKGLISEDKKEIVKNLYTSGISEDFIAMQVDLEIPVVISILKEVGVYREASAKWVKRGSSGSLILF